MTAGLPRFLPGTVSDQVRAILATAPPDGLSALAVANRLRVEGTEASHATVASALYRLVLDGRAVRERTSGRHLWRYRVTA